MVDEDLEVLVTEGILRTEETFKLEYLHVRYIRHAHNQYGKQKSAAQRSAKLKDFGNLYRAVWL
ncbi:MAG: hypothetical protein AB7S75_06980 [Desulfococcaceae bacterium]